jgi:hypothetical protein
MKCENPQMITVREYDNFLKPFKAVLSFLSSSGFLKNISNFVTILGERFRK